MRLTTLAVLACLLISCGASKITVPEGQWTLQKLKGQDVTALQKPVTLIFAGTEPSAKVVGFAGCNRYFGNYDQAKRAIKFSNIGSTKMFCEETMATETAFLKSLEEVTSFRVEENKLLMLSGDALILEFSH